MPTESEDKQLEAFERWVSRSSAENKTLYDSIRGLTYREMDEKFPGNTGKEAEWEAWSNWKHSETGRMRDLRRQPSSRPRVSFNKESWLTDLTYSIPITDLSPVTQRNLGLISQYHGVDWDDVALAIPVQYGEGRIEDFRLRARAGAPVRPSEIYRKSYMVEGTTPKGSEVIYFRKEGQHPSAGQSYVYVNGVQYLVSEFVKDPARRLEPILPEETEMYTQKKFEESPPRKRIPPSLVDTRLPEPEEIYPDKSSRDDLDWN